jgi:hypothetical protein
MEDLIKALQIFLKYSQDKYPTHCEWSKQTALDLQKKGINEPQVQIISVNSI